MPSLACFGRPILRGAGDVVLSGRPVQRHCLALLALLALERRGLPRERLTAYLWPECDARTAGHRLSVALHILRQRLGADSFAVTADALALAPGRWQVDVHVFEEALAEGELERARACYGAPLLDGFYLREAPGFEQWLESWRQRLERRYLALLETLAGEAERAGRLEAAVEYRQELVRREPYASGGILALMRVLAAAGRPERALVRARAYALEVREEFGLEPHPAVAAYADALARRYAATAAADRSPVA